VTKPSPPRHRQEFEIALICALGKESDAVEALFDGDWRDEGIDYGKSRGDSNAYTTGWIGGHNVVLAYMPNMGKASAARVGASLLSSFPGIRLGLIVGICGGVPTGTDNEEILLGDVIISTGVVQFDFGRRYPDGFNRKDTLNDNLGRPSAEIRAFLHKLKGKRSRLRMEKCISVHLRDLCGIKDFENSIYPGADHDKLFEPGYRHKHQNAAVCQMCATCETVDDSVCTTALLESCAELGCDNSKLVSRMRLLKLKDATRDGIDPVVAGAEAEAQPHETTTLMPQIHFGNIASGDTVMKSGLVRDQIACREKIIAFEMEGAGVWDSFPTIIIKGVCDYADSHKNKMWQEYAAATAASCMKRFLKEWSVVDRAT
jgi:nucleoside phosphorylase